jgi:hypothetical protein
MGKAGFVNRILLSTAGKRLQQNGLMERQKTVVIFGVKRFFIYFSDLAS